MVTLSVTEAVRKLCKYNSNDRTYGNPSLALKLGHSIKKCAQIKKCEGLLKDDEEMQKTAERFIELCSMEWSVEISSDALSTLYRRKWNKSELLPLAEDINRLQNYLKNQLQLCIEEVSVNANKKNYEQLCRVLIVMIVLFNRRRSGEVQYLEIPSYLNRDKSPCHEDVMRSLSDIEKKLISSFNFVETRGKKGRKVVILLRNEMVKGIELLIKRRKTVGVNESNPYVFARCNFDSQEPIRATDAIRKLAIEANLKAPSSITSTRLRKHVATMSQLFSLKDNELDVLASFLGHDIKIHREFYRLPEKTVILGKVSKVLLAAEKGVIHKYKGKSLEEINIEDQSSEEENSDSEFELFDAETPESSSFKRITKKTDTHKNNKKELKRNQGHKNNCNSNQESGGNFPKKNNKIAHDSRKIWSVEEKDAVQKHLSKFLLLKTVPGKKDCEECIDLSGSTLKARTWRQVKYFVYNKIKSHI